MSATIDSKVVEMKFNNSQFERNVKTSLTTLGKLKQSLNLLGATKGLDTVAASAKKCDMSSLSNAVDNVRLRFSALQVVAVTALTNITNSAINAGKNMISALTIDPIKTGLQEYETQINAIQTIMANTSSKGTTLDQVNDALDELNHYADMTIYNFTEMTRNIGTFTAAGVDLDTSVAAIKGIANLAAVSGSTSQQASTAMYQLSQALAAGTVKLMDWNSVVNAGMGGEVFQNALKETARVHGIAIDQMIKDEGSFRETLQHGWLTSEILTETLSKFTGDLTASQLESMGYTEDQIEAIIKMGKTANDAATKVKTFTQLVDTLKEAAQSGWTQTWEYIVGDFNQAKALWTKVSDEIGGVINDSANDRNEVVARALRNDDRLFSSMTSTLETAGISLDTFEDKVTEVAKRHGVDLESMIDDETTFSQALTKCFKDGSLSTDVLKESIGELVNGIAGTTTATEELKKVADQVINGAFGTGQARIKALTEAGYDYATVQNLVNEKLGVSYRHVSELAEAQGETVESLSLMSDEQLANKGYTEEQIQAIRDLKNMVDGTNTSIDEWAVSMQKANGATLLFEGIANIYQAIKDSLIAVNQAWKETFFGNKSDEEIYQAKADRIYALLEAFHKFTETLVVNDGVSGKITRTFKGLFAVVDILASAFSAVLRGVLEIVGYVLPPLLSGILTLTSTLGDVLVKARDIIKASGVFDTTVEKIVGIVKNLCDQFFNFVKLVKEKFATPGLEIFNNFLSRISTRMLQIKDVATIVKDGVTSAFNSLGSALSGSSFAIVITSLSTAVKEIGSTLASFVGDLVRSLSNANFDGIIDFLNGIATGGLIAAVTAFLTKKQTSDDSLLDTLIDFAKGLVSQPIDTLKDFVSSITSVLDEVRESIKLWQQDLKARTLLKLASALGILALSILILSTIDSDKLAVSLGAITVLFGELMGAMTILSNITALQSPLSGANTAMIAMSISILILATAVKKLADLDWDGIAKGLVGVGGLAAIMVGVARGLSTDTKHIIKGAASMIIFAIALKMLAKVCKQLASLSWKELAKGLTAVGVLFAEISLFLNNTKFSGKAILTATGVVILAAALNIMAGAVEKFGSMKPEQLANGLIAIGVALGEIVLAVKLMPKNMIFIGTGLAIVAAALNIIACALNNLSGLSKEQLSNSLIALGGALAELSIALNAMKGTLRGSASILIAAAALNVLAPVVMQFATLSKDQISNSIITLGGALAELSIALNAMNGTLKGSAALLVAVTALTILTPVLQALGKMSIKEIAKSLGVLAGVFVILGVAGALLGGTAVTIIALAGALVLLGVGLAALGAGITIIGVGLITIGAGVTALAAGLSAGAVTIATGIGVIITQIANLIVVVAIKLAQGIIAFCRVIAAGAPVIGEAIKALIFTLVDVLVECVPAIADGALQLVLGVLDALVTYAPQIVDRVIQFVIEILNVISTRLPELIEAAINVLKAFFQGVIDALGNIDMETIVQGVKCVGLLSAIMIALGVTASFVPAALAALAGMGIAIGELALILAAIGALAQIPGLTWLIGEGGELLQGIGTAIGQFIGGLVGGILEGVTEQLVQVGTDLSLFMMNLTPFLVGASTINETMLAGVEALASIILKLTAAELLSGVTSWLTGGSSLSDFAEELVPFGTAMKEFGEEIKDLDAGIVLKAAMAAQALSKVAENVPNSGGVISFFTGENDMDAFGDQLVPFGKAMKKFGDEVADINADEVSNAAIAGKALAEMATTIPNSGGVVSFFTGENDMDAFAAQLEPFGKAMKAFGDAVSGLESESVINAANAGKALCELGDTVPNSGGVVGFFAGNNDMGAFGEQLAAFGTAMKTYCDNLSGLDENGVTNSANCGTIISDLAKKLTVGTKNFFSQIVAGDMDTFKDHLTTFGQGVKDYSDSVVDLPVEELTVALDEINKILDVVARAATMDTSGLNGFSEGLKLVGSSGVDGFISAFTDANEQITEAAVTMVTAFKTGVENEQSNITTAFTTPIDDALDAIDAKHLEFSSAGGTIITKFTNGISNNAHNAKTAISNMMSSLKTTINDNQSSFTDSASMLITAFATGISDNQSTATDEIQNLISACVVELSKNTHYQDFYDVGEWYTKGFAGGIEMTTYIAEKKAAEMATKAADSAASAIEVGSPSKVTRKIGEWFGIGFINGINAYTNKSHTAAHDLATYAKTGLSSAVATIKDLVENGIDEEPTIRPVMDLSDIEEKTAILGAMLSRNQAVTIGANMYASAREANIQNGESTQPVGGNSYNFTQNNYSPKALSRIDIYRQTKNQFSTIERMAKT